MIKFSWGIAQPSPLYTTTSDNAFPFNGVSFSVSSPQVLARRVVKGRRRKILQHPSLPFRERAIWDSTTPWTNTSIPTDLSSVMSARSLSRRRTSCLCTTTQSATSTSSRRPCRSSRASSSRQHQKLPPPHRKRRQPRALPWRQSWATSGRMLTQTSSSPSSATSMAVRCHSHR